MRKSLVWIAVFTSASIIFSGCKSKEQPQAAKENTVTSEVKEKLAPDFTLKDHTGKEYKLSEYRGKVVVLEWFNYECPFCMEHYEKSTAMVDLASKYASKGVQWLAINSTSHQTTEANKAFIEKYNLPFPILDDRDGTVGRLYSATRTPEMFVIDKDGKIVYAGAIDNAPLGKVIDGGEKIDYVEKALDELLAGKKISVSKVKPYGCTVKYAK